MTTAGGRLADTTAHGIVSMLGAKLESPVRRTDLVVAVALVLASWAGFMGISGAHLGGPWKGAVLGVAPGPVLYGATLTAVLFVAWRLQAHPSGRDALAPLAWMVAAYLAGNGLSGLLHVGLQPEARLADAPAGLRFVASRLLYALGVGAPMLATWYVAYRRRPRFLETAGDWQVRTRLGKGDTPRTWARLLLVFIVGVGIPFFLLMQWQVDFRPLTGGRLVGLLPWIAAMALANAAAEELLFRGFLQGAAVRAAGAARGMWLVALVFGLHHWGASFAPLASLAGAVAVGAGSVLFAKSAHETGGLVWAICAHACINVGTFSAFYVAT